jgi:hypothetical protein
LQLPAQTGLIDVAARTARHGGGGLTLDLPRAWHREARWQTLFGAACGPHVPGLPDQSRSGQRAVAGQPATLR